MVCCVERTCLVASARRFSQWPSHLVDTPTHQILYWADLQQRLYRRTGRLSLGLRKSSRAVAVVVTTFTTPVFADMALAWRILAVFMAVEGGTRLSNGVNV